MEKLKYLEIIIIFMVEKLKKVFLKIKYMIVISFKYYINFLHYLIEDLLYLKKKKNSIYIVFTFIRMNTKNKF